MVRIPTLHLNGSGAKTLIAQNKEALRAINTAIDALSKAAPHGRDYYPQGENAINVALADHRRRAAALDDIRCELMSILIGIQGACNKS